MFIDLPLIFMLCFLSEGYAESVMKDQVNTGLRSKLRKFFPLLAVLLLAPWPIAYAHDYASASPQQGDKIEIEVAAVSAQPSWNAFSRSIGGVDTPGDLFYVDADENSGDIEVTLYITNARELSHCYKYIILKVGIYVEDDTDEWTAASSWNGASIPSTFITMGNGEVSFSLAGGAKYKITIDRGSFYCFRSEADGGSLSPQFYLIADPA